MRTLMDKDLKELIKVRTAKNKECLKLRNFTSEIN